MSEASPDLLVHNARLIGHDDTLAPGWLLVRDGVIAARGRGAAPTIASDRVDGEGGFLCPGFVDIHVHGGGGWSGETGGHGITGMAAFHRRHGTTALVVSLATAPWETLLDRLDAVSRAARTDLGILGSHLEGPFLDTAHRGAHDESLLRRPTLALVREALDAADGTLRQVTLAPELAGGEIIDAFVSSGVRVAIGHTSATREQTGAAFAQGAGILTHAFNGMPGIHHRTPGPVVAAWESNAILEVIADGVHVDPAVVAMLFALAPGRIALVTDAMAAAGSADGDYPLGGHVVTVRGGIARLGEHGSLAGSTLTLDRAVRVCVDAGVPLADAVRAATATPARAIGDTTRGTLDVGARGDLVLLDPDLNVRRTWRAGVAA